MIYRRPLILTGPLIKKITEVLRSQDDIVFAAVVGPLARGGFSYQGLKLAVKIREGADREAALRRAITELAFVLNIPETWVDLVDMEKAGPYLKEEVVRHGIVLLDKEDYKDRLVDELNVFYKRPLGEAQSLPRLTKPDTALLERKLEVIRLKSNFLERYILKLDVDVVKRSPMLSRLLEDHLRSVIEAVAGICRYIVAAMGISSAASYSEAVAICVREGIIEPEVGEALKRAVRLRNRIAQGLLVRGGVKINYDMLYAEATSLLKVLRAFEDQIIGFLEELSLQKAASRPKFY